MALTTGSGPFGHSPGGVFNMPIGAPDGHVLYFEGSPKRVRVELGGETVADSRRAKMLHETRHLPVYYFPRQDVRADLLSDSDHTTRCPYKGEARYHHVTAGDRTVENAVWYYPEPLEGAPPLAEHLAFYFDRMDRWLEEDEEIFVHPRDPYHRVEVLRSSRQVTVRLGGETIADTSRPRILFETGLPPRYYLHPEDVRKDALVDSDHHTQCPYKGVASYKSVKVGDEVVDDAAWFYPEPLREALDVAGWLCFYPEKVELDVKD